MKKLIAVLLIGAMSVTLVAQGFISGGTGIRFTSAGWIVFGTAAPGSDARATAAPYGSFYCRQNTTSSTCYVKRSTVAGTTWEEFATGSGLAAIADDRVLANVSGSSAVPTATTLTALLDATGCSTNDKILKRVSGTWQCADDGGGGGSGGGGGLISMQVLTSGTAATYTVPAGVFSIRVAIVGGGGGGGGLDGTTAGASAGGAGGGYSEKVFVTSPGATFQYSIGAFGAGGLAGNNGGSSGTATTFDELGSVMTANGGGGGASMATGSTFLGAAGGTGGTASGGTFNLQGDHGGTAARFSGTVFVGGAGGRSHFGHGGYWNINTAGGVTASGSYGAGGGGGIVSSGVADLAGGNGAPGAIVIWEFGTPSTAGMPGLCQFRLTTETGVPISTSDRTAQSTIYLTPYNGNHCSVYNGSMWVALSMAEESLALSGLTADKNYDVFLDYNGGSPQLVLSAAWTNDTTRAGALTTQDGVYVKSGDLDHLYVGTIRTTGTTTTEDSGGGSVTNVGGKRFVWNVYNRVERVAEVIDTTTNWSYLTNTWRQARATAGNQVEYVVGLADDVIDASVLGAVLVGGNTTNAAKVGVGLDSTTAVSGQRSMAYLAATGTLYVPVSAQYRGYPGIGYHFVAWLEKGGSVQSAFVGSENDSQSGLTVRMKN